MILLPSFPGYHQTFCSRTVKQGLKRLSSWLCRHAKSSPPTHQFRVSGYQHTSKSKIMHHVWPICKPHNSTCIRLISLHTKKQRFRLFIFQSHLPFSHINPKFHPSNYPSCPSVAPPPPPQSISCCNTMLYTLALSSVNARLVLRSSSRRPSRMSTVGLEARLSRSSASCEYAAHLCVRKDKYRAR